MNSRAIVGGAGLVLASLTMPAAAHTFTRCDWHGTHCVRIHCDWDADNCWRQSMYHDRAYYRGHGGGHWVCDRWGDCHWAYWQPDPSIGVHLNY